MIKRTFALMTLMGSAAVAGPYVNFETNGSWSEDSNENMDYTGSVHELHLGYKDSLGDLNWFGQIGPSFNAPDAADHETDFSGKIGADINATEELSFYGELSGTSGDNRSFGTKFGATYDF